MSGDSSQTSFGFSLPNFASNPITEALAFTSPAGIFAADAGGIKNTLSPTSPSLSSPTALSSTPTQAQTNTTAIQTQLASESAARAYGSGISTGAGLLTAPSTSSRILLGS